MRLKDISTHPLREVRVIVDGVSVPFHVQQADTHTRLVVDAPVATQLQRRRRPKAEAAEVVEGAEVE